MNIPFHKRAGALVLGLLLLCSASATLAPRPAHAVFGIGDITFDPTNFATNFAQTTIMQSLNGLAWAAAKVAIQSITKSTVNWILSGYQGSPAFVTDLNTNLRQVGDAYANAFITQLTTEASIKSPFINDIARAAGAAYYANSNKNAIVNQLQYTLNTVVANDKAFINGTNFHQGGFNAWLAMTQNPANNPFGANYIVGEQLAQGVAATTNNRIKELDFGKGFLSFKGECTLTAGQLGNSTSAADQAGLGVDLSDADKCLSNKIETPGSVVESQLENQLGSSVRQLELADSINEIFTAAVTQLVGQALGGVSGLLGASSPSSGGGSSALSNATNPAVFSTAITSAGQGFSQTISTQIAQLQFYQQNEQGILDEANLAKATLTSRSCPDSNSLLASLVQPAINQSSANVGRANAAITKLTSLQTQLTTAQQSSTQADQVASVTSQYQTLLSSGATPSATDIGNSVTDGTDTGTTGSPSLFTQLKQIATRTSCSTS